MIRIFQAPLQVFTWFLYLQKICQTLERPTLTLSGWIRSKSDKIRHQVFFFFFFQALIDVDGIKMFGDTQLLNAYFCRVPVQTSEHKIAVLPGAVPGSLGAGTDD